MTTAKLQRRPPKTSRRQIIDTAIGILSEHGRGKLTIKRLADQLAVTPMAIYNHVDDKDHLLNCVATRLLGDLRPQLPNKRWQDQIRAWANQVRAHFLEHPYLIELLAWEGHTSSAWLDQMALLLDVLPESDMKKPEQLITVQWICHSFVGFMLFEISAANQNMDVDLSDLDELNNTAKERLTPFFPMFKKYDASKMFLFNLNQLIVALEAKLNG